MADEDSHKYSPFDGSMPSYSFIFYILAGEEGQAVKEPAISEDAGVLAAVRHLMQRYAEEKDSLLSSLAGLALCCCQSVYVFFLYFFNLMIICSM